MKTLKVVVFLSMFVAGCGVTVSTHPILYHSVWIPGHIARVCEQRSTGTVCFDRWIAHPRPDYGYPEIYWP